MKRRIKGYFASESFFHLAMDYYEKLLFPKKRVVFVIASNDPAWCHRLKANRVNESEVVLTTEALNKWR